MAIKVTIAAESPALIYDHFFLDNLELIQKPHTDNAQTPYYTLRVTYHMYAIDTDGQRHYQPKANIIELQDYYAEALARAATGDMDLANAAGAIEIALARIISELLPQYGEASVV